MEVAKPVMEVNKAEAMAANKVEAMEEK